MVTGPKVTPKIIIIVTGEMKSLVNGKVLDGTDSQLQQDLPLLQAGLARIAVALLPLGGSTVDILGLLGKLWVEGSVFTGMTMNVGGTGASVSSIVERITFTISQMPTNVT